MMSVAIRYGSGRRRTGGGAGGGWRMVRDAATDWGGARAPTIRAVV